MVQFSQRNSPVALPDEREKLWLPLLQLLITAHNKYQGTPDLSVAFNEMNKHLLSSMMGHVSLPTIVEVVMNNPSYQTATFAEIRDLVTGRVSIIYLFQFFPGAVLSTWYIGNFCINLFLFCSFQVCWKPAHMKI
jgi:hypothetical protein